MITVKCLASGSAGNSYAIDDGESVLLLEAGIPHKRILGGYIDLLPRVAGCAITHEHQDHCRGAAGLAASGIDLYATEGTFRGVKGVRHPYRKHIVRDGQRFDIGSWSVLPFKTEHDPPGTFENPCLEPCGFVVTSKTTSESLLFATDTYYLQYRFYGLSVIMVECNYSPEILQKNVDSGKVLESMAQRLRQSHFGLDDVKDFLRATDLSLVRQIYLLHRSAGNGDRELFEREIKQLTGKPVTVF